MLEIVTVICSWVTLPAGRDYTLLLQWNGYWQASNEIDATCMWGKEVT